MQVFFFNFKRKENAWKLQCFLNLYSIHGRTVKEKLGFLISRLLPSQFLRSTASTRTRIDSHHNNPHVKHMIKQARTTALPIYFFTAKELYLSTVMGVSGKYGINVCYSLWKENHHQPSRKWNIERWASAISFSLWCMNFYFLLVGSHSWHRFHSANFFFIQFKSAPAKLPRNLQNFARERKGKRGKKL